MPAKIFIEGSVVEDLYYNQNKSKKQICEILKVSIQTLNRRLLELDIKIKIRSHKFKNLIKEKFGKLQVISYAGLNRHGRAIWLCKCECGKEKKIWGECLGKYTFSCGCLKQQKNFKGYGKIGKVYWRYILRSAIKRNLEFSITIDQAWNQFNQQNNKCALSGIELKFANPNTTVNKQTASLDRIDSSRGYVIDNIQWVHKDINKMKNYFDDTYFIKMCKKVSRYRRKRRVISSHSQSLSKT